MHLPAREYKSVCDIMFVPNTCKRANINLHRNSIQTVTVYVTTTQYQQTHGVTTVFNAGGNVAATTTQGGGGGIAIVGQATGEVTYNGYCTTIYAANVDKPTTAPANCGVALVVNGNGSARPIAMQVLSSVTGFWCVMFIVGLVTFGFRR
jgi:hypothetical protein